MEHKTHACLESQLITLTQKVERTLLTPLVKLYYGFITALWLAQ